MLDPDLVYHTPTSRQGSQSPQPVETLSGHSLVIGLHRRKPRQRAKLAAGLVRGTVQVTNLTRKQAATIAGVSLPLVHEAVRGVSTPRMIVAWWEQASPADRVELIRGFGASDTWDALAAVIA